MGWRAIPGAFDGGTVDGGEIDGLRIDGVEVAPLCSAARG